MKILLYLFCVIGIAVKINYFGIQWWTFPILMTCLVIVKSHFDSLDARKDDLIYGIKAATIIYFIGVTIYIFAGDSYLDRAINSYDSFKVFSNVIAAIPLPTIFVRSTSTGHSGVSGMFNDSHYEPHEEPEIPENYMSPDDRHFRQIQDEMNRQHQEAEDMGYFK